MRLEPGADGKPPPKPRRRRNVASGATCSFTASAGTGNAEGEEPDEDTVNIPYKIGVRDAVQSWTYRTPESITVDCRLEERHRPAINRDRSSYLTPYDFFVNVALPMPLIKRMFDEQGWMNQRLSGVDNSYHNRKTSVGEGLQFIGYMIALANNPGRRLRAMWSERERPGEKSVLPPPNIGRFGMPAARFHRLQALVPECYSISMHELDPSDPWRFIKPFINGFNAHWNEVYIASWLLSPDELMSMWTADEGDGPHDIPFLSYVPRKPKPKGCEMKTVCDGESGCLLRVELALEYKRKRGDVVVVPPYSDEFSLTAAQCLRLSEPWHKTGRVFGADAHFSSVESMEALREHVRPYVLRLLMCSRVNRFHTHRRRAFTASAM